MRKLFYLLLFISTITSAQQEEKFKIYPARDLGQGQKVNPFIVIKPGETFTMAEITGTGAGDGHYNVCIGSTRKLRDNDVHV